MPEPSHKAADVFSLMVMAKVLLTPEPSLAVALTTMLPAALAVSWPPEVMVALLALDVMDQLTLLFAAFSGRTDTNSCWVDPTYIISAPEMIKPVTFTGPGVMGWVVGGVTGIVTGWVVGGVTGIVTGWVVGGVTGIVTGPVEGTDSGTEAGTVSGAELGTVAGAEDGTEGGFTAELDGSEDSPTEEPGAALSSPSGRPQADMDTNAATDKINAIKRMDWLCFLIKCYLLLISFHFCLL